MDDDQEGKGTGSLGAQQQQEEGGAGGRDPLDYGLSAAQIFLVFNGSHQRYGVNAAFERNYMSDEQLEQLRSERKAIAPLLFAW